MMKNYRTLAFGALALTLAITSVSSQEAQATKRPTHEGKVVSATNAKLVMTSKDGKMHSHVLTDATHVTLDGRVCRAEVLKQGTRIRVTTKVGDVLTASRIEAIDKSPEFTGL